MVLILQTLFATTAFVKQAYYATMIGYIGQSLVD